MSKSGKTCWIVTEGINGTENQCIGLAEALSLTPVVKRISLRFPWQQLTPWLPYCDYALGADSDPLAPPYPDILITSGRKAISAGIAIRKKNKKTFHVHLQDPRVSSHFDLLIVPQHDKARGKNVVVTKAALHRVTPEKLAAGRQQFEKELSKIPHPRVAVLIGGNSKAHTMTPENTKALTQQLLQLAERGAAGLLITASRRTGEENTKYLRDTLKGDNIHFWDGKGENHFFGYLALADYIIVTEDSVSMTSEALATGKPVYIATLEGGARRLNLFHKLLQEEGYTRPFTGMLEQWSYTPPDDVKQAADKIREKLKGK